MHIKSYGKYMMRFEQCVSFVQWHWLANRRKRLDNPLKHTYCDFYNTPNVF